MVIVAAWLSKRIQSPRLAGLLSLVLIVIGIKGLVPAQP